MQTENFNSSFYQWLDKANSFLYTDYIFSPAYRLHRHLTYWLFHITLWAMFWYVMEDTNFWRVLFNMALWVPLFIAFSYPLAYIGIPNLLLKNKIWQFFLLVLTWGLAGLYINPWYRDTIYIPIQEAIGFKTIPARGFHAHSYLCMTTSAASPMFVRFFKLWTYKQQDWMRVQQQKLKAELQLMKAQVKPHFLFNTLHNIYTFSLAGSPETPQLILKLSSLLNYILYECKSDEVRLEKELEIMKNYVDLEQQRFVKKIDISWSIEGSENGMFIAPLLLLPFLENAFNLSKSELITSPWMSIDISLKNDHFNCKIANSKSEFIKADHSSCGFDNLKHRLALIYPDRHFLKMDDEGDFFVVLLKLMLSNQVPEKILSVASLNFLQNNQHETPLPAYR